MNYFIDTNVGIAFSIFPDMYHPQIKILINTTKRKIYWSTFAQLEYNKKFNEITDNIDDFLDEIYETLANNPDILNYDEFRKNVLLNSEYIPIDNHKKIKIINCIWNNENFNLNSLETIMNISRDISKYFITNNNQLMQKIELYDCGKNNYKNFSEINERLMKLKIHFPDNIIVIDAHDLSKKQEITFITADKKLYDIISTKCHFLNIQKYKLIKHTK